MVSWPSRHVSNSIRLDLLVRSPSLYEDIYYTAFPDDRITHKILVYSTFIAETVQTVMITYDAFQNFAFGFGKVDGLVAFIVQSYFAYRIHLLSGSKVIAGLVLLMALAQVSGAIATGVVAKSVGVFSKIREPCFIPALFWLGGSAACDVTIAIAMTYVLSRRFDDVFHETRDLLKRVIRLTMETGSLTAAFAAIDLILFLAFPTQDYHITPALALSKLYSNSLLVVFNSRVQIQGGRGSSFEASRGNVTGFGSGGMVSARGPSTNIGMGVRCDVEESVWADPIPLNNVNLAKRQSGSSARVLDKKYLSIRPDQLDSPK
ncbi:hypothetical protein E1B28_008227 [Marasmius oreades]|uniref:DUF6534 domain-containing protein n=1 Tax=Marasmius oreades TaxID=181124 RepID=A0A9P7RYJ3_9AGAR|nr:uncharacterized protein E1B28_008227 [Marasmius oreades]KAG7091823.1 hypothetical protein E1B28_008227 [Marasmius oreades]